MIPQSLDQAMRLADMMARGKMVPDHLRNPADALMVIEQAMRWGMSPFAVAQCTSVIQGKLMFSGVLVSAAVQSSGILATRLSHTFAGEGDKRSVTIKGTIKGEAEPREITIQLKDAKTNNGMWVKQPDQQLVYFGTRAWARRHTPEVMLGVYSPEEFEETARVDQFPGTTIDAMPEAPEPLPTPRKQTQGEWLDALRAELEAAPDYEAVCAIEARPQVQIALDKFRNGAKTALNAMIQEAINRTEPDDGGAPNGDAGDDSPWPPVTHTEGEAS